MCFSFQFVHTFGSKFELFWYQFQNIAVGGAQNLSLSTGADHNSVCRHDQQEISETTRNDFNRQNVIMTYNFSILNVIQ